MRNLVDNKIIEEDPMSCDVDFCNKMTCKVIYILKEARRE